MRRLINTALGVVFGIAFTLAHAQSEWVDIKDPKELRALYSNKTFKGKDYLDRQWVGHYRLDGQGVVIMDGQRYPRTWEVKSSDLVCVHRAMSAICYRLQRHRSRLATYRVLNEAGVSQGEFTVEDGIPKF